MLKLRSALVLALLLVGCATLLGGCATTSTSTQSSDDAAGSLKACTANGECGDDQYCRFALGACGGTGSCEARPEVCTFEFDPVCACDQNTYSNACGAASEGLSILKPGRCGTDA